MPPHQERVVKEEAELSGNIGRLSTFLVGDIFKTLPADEQERLSRQVKYMKLYDDVLVERIKAFS